MPQNTYYIETYGCQMNDHDSEKMSSLLDEIGMAEVYSPEEAEVIILNTCSIREKAEHKVYSALGRLKALKARNPHIVTVVAGCVAQQQKEKLLKKADHLDAVLGTHCIADLPDVVQTVRKKRRRLNRTEFHPEAPSLHILAPAKGPSPVRSYVTIMQGCSNFCSYCVVPFTRGPEQSRPPDRIVAEVQELGSKGIREITLLGQNVNAYGKDLSDATTFAELLRELDSVQELSRIRFTTSHPRDFNEDLIAAMADLATVCEHIHLPLQSGSDDVLHAMRRGYTCAEYLHKVRKLRDRIPRVAVTADIIVGFPGETEDDFQQTLMALQEIRFDQIFSFKFSPRPGTAASKLEDQVPEEVKVRRLAEVHTLQDRVTGDYHRAAEGTVEEVLIEGIRPDTDQAFGRSRTNKIVNLDSSRVVRIGDTIPVKILRGLKHSLTGEPLL